MRLSEVVLYSSVDKTCWDVFGTYLDKFSNAKGAKKNEIEEFVKRFYDFYNPRQRSKSACSNCSWSWRSDGATANVTAMETHSTTVPSPNPSLEMPRYPFAALVGVPDVQLALLLVAIDPTIGGVLIRGPRGTAKSTAARALADLLPGAPFVQLPLGPRWSSLLAPAQALERAAAGGRHWRPGLLARAHGGVLVDEVNLLPDALADVLLDAAASGVHTVERDGISQRHAARFALIGTMNPEEGRLRPQLLDRFGLCVELSNPSAAAARAAVDARGWPSRPTRRRLSSATKRNSRRCSSACSARGRRLRGRWLGRRKSSRKPARWRCAARMACAAT